MKLKLELSEKNVDAVTASMIVRGKRAQQRLRKAVRTSGDNCKALTQLFCAVDTGFMQEHVKTVYADAGLSFETGWEAMDFFDAGRPFYPPFVEFGTRFMSAQPALGPAFAEIEPQLIEDISSIMIEEFDTR